MTALQYSQLMYLTLCELGNDADDNIVGIAMDKFGNINLARAERDADRAAELEESMRHVRRTAGYQKSGAYGVFGGGK